MPQQPPAPMGAASTTYKATFEIQVSLPEIQLEGTAVVTAQLYYRSRPDAEPVLAQLGSIASGTWAEFTATTSPKLIKFTPTIPGFYFVNFTAITLTGSGASAKVTRITTAQSVLIPVIR